MLLQSKEVISSLLELKYYYLKQGRYTRAECFGEAINVVNSLERGMDENTGRVFKQPSKG